MRPIISTVFISVFFVFLSGCNMDEIDALSELEDQDKTWVFVQFNVAREGGNIKDYFYFGEMDTSLYNKITSNQIRRGFINLKNIRFWNTDDVIESTEDDLYANEMVFRIEDIKKIDLVKKEPPIGYKYADSETNETAKEPVKKAEQPEVKNKLK